MIEGFKPSKPGTEYFKRSKITKARREYVCAVTGQRITKQSKYYFLTGSDVASKYGYRRIHRIHGADYLRSIGHAL